MKKIFAFFLIVICLNHFSQAQTDSADKSKTQLKLSVNYNSHLNYYGRTDSLRSSGFFPMAELWFNDNFYVTAAPIFVINKGASFNYAGTVATAGYQFVSSGKKWLGNFNFVKPLYESNSQLVQSSLKAQGGFTITNLNQFIDVTAGADVKFSDKVDYGLTGGLDHIVRKQFADNSVLVVDPSAYVYAGTQQFTRSYYKKNNFLGVPGVGQAVSTEVQNFNILSYEFSIPVIFAKDKFQFYITPAYLVPQNLITVQGRPDLSERGQEMFYATIGAKVVL